MRLLIVCRHGNYVVTDGRQYLTEAGRKEIAALAGTIMRLTKENERITLLSSTAPRAVESAEVIQSMMGLPPFERTHDLSIEYGVNESAGLHLVETHAPDTDVLILMTHLEYCRIIPVQVAKTLALTIRERDLQTGSAQAIFMDEKRVRIL